MQILGESSRLRIGDAIPATSPWFDGAKLALTAARGEIVGLQVVHTGGGAVTVRWDGAGVTVRSYAVEPLTVARPSTALYGGSHGAGRYPDALIASAAPASDPAYLELEVARNAAPGVVTGELVVGARHVPVSLTISPVRLPPLPIRVWAYDNPAELTWHLDDERACIQTFRRYGVLLSPDVHLVDWPARKPLLGDPRELRDVPVWISDYPPFAAAEVKAWIAAFRGTGQVPFAIPIDEPHGVDGRKRVRALADVVRAAGGGPTTFRFAVTDVPNDLYGDAVDLYIPLTPKRGDREPHWTYNGAPPRAGSMVLDAESPGMRTWGWIAWRWQIATWYVWDATYWHDRHNRKRVPMPAKALDARRDAVSFDDDEDHGNLDGVLALPGCQPTLRMAQLRRGYEDYQLLELAAACDRGAAEQLAAQLVPVALGDAPATGKPAWPSDEAAWEAARRQLLAIASRCASP